MYLLHALQYYIFLPHSGSTIESFWYRYMCLLPLSSMYIYLLGEITSPYMDPPVCCLLWWAHCNVYLCIGFHCSTLWTVLSMEYAPSTHTCLELYLTTVICSYDTYRINLGRRLTFAKYLKKSFWWVLENISLLDIFHLYMLSERKISYPKQSGWFRAWQGWMS